jgi:hypothetical protein
MELYMVDKQFYDRQEILEKKSSDLIEKLEQAKKTKEKIYLYLESNAEKLKEDQLMEASRDIKKILEMGDESFDLLTKDISNDDIDRTQSMLCGPLYCSKEYPHPINRKGTKLIPILQIDLKWLSAVTGKQLGDKMLQLWFDHELTDPDYGTIRLIPLDDMRLDGVIEFDEEIWSDINRQWIPGSWIYPFEKRVKQITGVVSFGFTVPESDIDNILMEHYYDSGGDFHDELFENLMDFTSGLFELNDQRAADLECHLFGKFYPIKMASTDFSPNTCFISINDFAGGRAQIFKSPSGGFSFNAAN